VQTNKHTKQKEDLAVYYLKSATKLSRLVSMHSIGELKLTNVICDGEGHKNREERLKFKSFVKERTNKSALWHKSRSVEIERLYCETSFRSSKDNLSMCQNRVQIFVSLQMDLIIHTLAYVGKLIGIHPASPESRQIQSRQQISNKKCDSFFSTQSFNTIEITDPSIIAEDLLSPATYIIINREDDMDDWGHFMDFQDNEYYATNTMSDPFQSLTKNILRRRGVKIPVGKLEEVKEVDSFIGESE